MQDTLRELLDFAHRAAWEAGKITLRYFQTGIAAELKSDESPVTIADREAEAFLRSAITTHYPQHAILGEEEGATGHSDAEWRWILDPIDGTRAFVRGMPLYGVMVGLEHRGEPVLGVINMPALNEITYAARGLGCWWNGRPCRVSQVPRLHDGLLVATTADDRYARTGRKESFERLVNAAGMFRTWGDCYGYVLVATGRAEATLDPIVSVWDVAAAYPIVREAGGTFTDWQGNATIHNKEGIGTNALVFDEIMQLIKGS
ncbi:MAG: inositol monophosphatase family protein [Chloroflexaceae bacterium]|nr:inositol monophosphatase family protein [Chloroflexaceae bacterium]NJL33670.1 inositol monophosphatase family protein [Chloroflexaceae bacterium]NJO05573.1 inositol monophosphatase family protein [Chloroflexaceae bacterium]